MSRQSEPAPPKGSHGGAAAATVGRSGAAPQPPLPLAYHHHTNFLAGCYENAVQRPDTVFCRWIDSKCVETDRLTHAQLWDKAGQIAALLRKNGVGAGDRVMISYPFGLA